LIPIEVSILEAAIGLQATGQVEAHGYQLASTIRDIHHAKRLTSYGTLYKALNRLERDGYLASRWEDPHVAAAESRPRRRFYRLTAKGETAINEERAANADAPPFRAAASAIQ